MGMDCFIAPYCAFAGVFLVPLIRVSGHVTPYGGGQRLLSSHVSSPSQPFIIRTTLKSRPPAWDTHTSLLYREREQRLTVARQPNFHQQPYDHSLHSCLVSESSTTRVVHMHSPT
ncbi:hypothetical protein C8Q80DRAFT_678825 [Daedaleopsis nitida]|nr:hypothetical protein C8Q80DRAFT_678825 [Daedaleopsis nitida]